MKQIHKPILSIVHRLGCDLNNTLNRELHCVGVACDELVYCRNVERKMGLLQSCFCDATQIFIVSIFLVYLLL